MRQFSTVGGALEAVAKLLRELWRKGRELRFVYGAGPFGLKIYRFLREQEIACTVVSTSQIPRLSGDRVRTDRRDPEPPPGAIAPASSPPSMSENPRTNRFATWATGSGCLRGRLHGQFQHRDHGRSSGVAGGSKSRSPSDRYFRQGAEVRHEAHWRTGIAQAWVRRVNTVTVPARVGDDSKRSARRGRDERRGSSRRSYAP